MIRDGCHPERLLKSRIPAWPAVFLRRVDYEGYVYQISCLHHHIEDSYEICNNSLH